MLFYTIKTFAVKNPIYEQRTTNNGLSAFKVCFPQNMELIFCFCICQLYSLNFLNNPAFDRQ